MRLCGEMMGDPWAWYALGPDEQSDLIAILHAERLDAQEARENGRRN